MKGIDFFIIGTQKSATTALFSYLKNHYDIYGHEQKELAFFMNDQYFDQGIDYMLDHFFPGATSDKKLLAKHAMLIYSEKAIERLSKFNSQAKLILVVRDPVKRAYSAYWYARRRGWEDIQSFEKALAKEKSRLEQDGWEKWRNNMYVENGYFGKYLSICLKYFAPEQLIIVNQKSLLENPSLVLSSVCTFLGINDDIQFEQTVHNEAAMSRNENVSKIMAWFFKPDNPIKLLIKKALPKSKLYKVKDGLLKMNEREAIIPEMNEETKKRLSNTFLVDQDFFRRLIDNHKIREI